MILRFVANLQKYRKYTFLGGSAQIITILHRFFSRNLSQYYFNVWILQCVLISPYNYVSESKKILDIYEICQKSFYNITNIFLFSPFFSFHDQIYSFSKYCLAFPFPFFFQIFVFFSSIPPSVFPQFSFSTDQIFLFSKYIPPCPSLFFLFPAYQLTNPPAFNLADLLKITFRLNF